MIALQVLMVLAALAVYSSMPYQVPLQGLVGGKRTLVLLDDLVIYTTHIIMFFPLIDLLS
jgi:hypothetical protein